MTSILSIPLDILILFSEYIDDEDDFLSLRMTCKAFNEKFRDAHLKSIYTTRRLFYALESFENLLKISRHPSEMNMRVRKLIICWATPYHDFREEGRTIYQIGSTARHSELDKVKNILRGFVEVSKEKMEEITRFRSSGKDIALLSSALAGFPNLRWIHVERGRMFQAMFTRSETNLFFPTLKLTPGKRLHGLLKELGDNYGMMRGKDFLNQNSAKFLWDLPLSSLVFFGDARFEVLTCKLGADGLMANPPGLSLDQLSLYKTAFINLKVLHLKIDVTHTLWTRGIETNGRFCVWLEAVGSNLEELDFYGFFFQDDDALDKALLPVKIGLPKLKRLRLSASVLSRTNLEQFLDKCKAGLRELNISHCSMGGIQASTEWYSVLQWLGRNCHWLQKLNLRPHYDTRGNPWGDTPTQVSWIDRATLPFLRAETSEQSIFGKCDWMVWREYINRTLYQVLAPVGNALKLYHEPETFWLSITHGKWRSQAIIRKREEIMMDCRRGV